MAPGAVADLDEDELEALIEAVREREQENAWGNLHEICASIVEALWAIGARMDGGLPVVLTKQSKEVGKPDRYPRPKWIKVEQEQQGENADEDDVIVVHSVREALGVLKVIPGGKGGA